MKMKRLSILVILAAAVLLVAFPSLAAKKNTLTVGFYTKFGTLDYYKTSTRVSIQFGYMVWDSLVVRDAETGKIYPGLARSWKIINPTTWEFKLQPGVKFHNGNPCTSEAVRYTIEERALEPKATRLGNFKWIKKVEVIDDLTFRIITHKPFPVVLERLNTLFIYDPIYCKEVGDRKVAEAPMGTGPYRFVKWDRGSQLVFKRNPNYWQKGIPKIETVICRPIPEMSTRVSELISGGIDYALNLTPDMWPVLEKSKNVVPMNVPILRINFYQFDGDGGASKTPLTDKRVRQAVIHAIDRKAIIKNVMRGFGGELHSPMHPLQFGYDPSVKESYEYNPEKAKALLKEAGYEKGFTIDLWQYNGFQRQPNQAVMGYLAKMGIKVNLKDYIGNTGPMIRLRNSGKITGIGNFAWGSSNIFDCEGILPLWFTLAEGKNYNRDKELDGWLLAARGSVDPEERKKLYSKAVRRITEEAYWMPFFIVHQIYGRNKDLHCPAGIDECPRFAQAYWK